MTLSLYVLRHAKAEEAVSGGDDHARVLKRRGRKAAELVGRFLKRLDEAPDLVLCSSAVRARETAQLAREAGGWDALVELDGALYEAGVEGLLQRIATVPAETKRLLLVGHQPALSLLLAELTGAEPDFPAGALARVDLVPSDWSALGPGSGRLAWLLTPEVLGAT
jgi:phosphohistidine phosphatase